MTAYELVLKTPYELNVHMQLMLTGGYVSMHTVLNLVTYDM